MMGGLGSGRPKGFGRKTTDGIRSIDINRMHQAGCLRPGSWGGWQWSRNGENVASINVRAEADRLHLSYRVRRPGSEWQEVEETVQIIRVPCHIGGSRPYFICPGAVNGVVCGRRVAKLFGTGRYFLCRYCYGLSYESQNESVWDRAIRRAHKIRDRLGENLGIDEPFPPRPKGMWRRTYDRLCERAYEAEELASEALVMQAARILASSERSSTKRRNRS